MSVVVFMGGWLAVSLATAFAMARVTAFAARNDTREPEALAAYARRPGAPRHLALVPRGQRRA